ncbi:MAG: 4-phosphoerythronate dehydrogenase [Succinivibrio sp.]|nr:4-phosphoerythronate dehydrogenase [Succinivibrio sp.]MCI7773774.1 4-phosphoerythronate dehydrogenase [Succinivibrio sp.]MCI7784663.1 4-phosphoerythronate dehydrogenase [Succinivibrio sp.]MDY5188349.1 4-phosphoerythronate dehydrogenase [Succinivibrio sp.]
MKILCDIALPNSVEVFSQYGEVALKNGRQINADDLVDVDVLIIRSITKVNEDLLSKANKLKFVGTATAGMDHIDTALLDKKGIAYSNAQGSNCESVGDYILSVLLVLAEKYSISFEGKSIGIVGCGFVGSQVYNKAKALGLTIVKNDPPRFKAGDKTCSATLDEALACDIVTLHVPLIQDGEYKTLHLIDEQNLLKLKPNAIFINASRGNVVDNEALSEFLEKRSDIKVWLDVFEGEPEINCKKLLSQVDGATAHIAGYSYESKRRANVMLAFTLAKVLKLEEPKAYVMPKPEIESTTLGKVENLDLDLIRRLVFSVYDVRRDSLMFKNCFKNAKSFDAMRSNYRERRELSSLHLLNVEDKFKEQLSLLGFSVD